MWCLRICSYLLLCHPCHGVHIKYNCYDMGWIVHTQTCTLTYSMHKLNKNSSSTEINPNNHNKDIVKHL